MRVPVSVLVSVGFAIPDFSCLLASRVHRYEKPVVIGVLQLLATQDDFCLNPVFPILSLVRLPIPPLSLTSGDFTEVPVLFLSIDCGN